MRFRDPGYTPAFRELGALLELVDEGDDDAVKAILRIDAQHRPKIAKAVAERARKAVRPARGRLTRLAGRVGAVEWLVDAVGDEDPKTRHTAARALSRIDATPGIAKAVLAAWDEGNEEDRRALADALARVGGDEAKKRLPKTTRASLMLERDEARATTEAAIDVDASLEEPRPIRFHSRAGLEAIVAMEIGEAKVVRAGVVEAMLRGPLSRALAVRTATHVSFPHRAKDIVDVVATAPELRTFTKGRPIRFRVAGTTRAEAWKIAERTRAIADDVVNDPRASTLEVFVDEVAGEGVVHLVPRGYEDQRFTYRTELVPASSHPTIAAAIALVAPRKAMDVVWDPFVGAGAELVERARLGPYARLVGTDIDPKAVHAARTNLANAGVKGALIEESDALAYDVRPTLILTNPPMGRRVQRGTHRDVLERFVERAAEVLTPGGHLVWTVPEPKKIEARARRAGLSLERSWSVDMGGFEADLAVYRKRG